MAHDSPDLGLAIFSPIGLIASDITSPESVAIPTVIPLLLETGVLFFSHIFVFCDLGDFAENDFLF